MQNDVTQLWDGLGEEQRSQRKAPVPLWSTQHTDDADLLKWLQGSVTYLKDINRDRFDIYGFYLNLYKGDHFQDRTYVSRDSLASPKKRTQMRRIAVNHAYELVEQGVSKLMRFKPAVVVMPVNNEYNDRINAKLGKYVIDHIFAINDIDRRMEQLQRYMRVFGCAYMYCRYDQESGDLHPDFAKQMLKLEKEGKDAPTITVRNGDGQRVKIDRPVRVGEVRFDVLPPWRVLLAPSQSYDESPFCVIQHIVDEMELVADYGEKARPPKKEADPHRAADDAPPEGKVYVYELFHRHSPHLRKGRYVKFTEYAVLEEGDHPYSHGCLPLIRLTDVDIPGEVHPVSALEFIAPLNRMYNYVTSFAWRNFAYGAHPKWLVPKGSANLVTLGNAMTVVEYAGGIAPRLEAFPTIPAEMFEFREQLRNEMEKIYGIHSVSRGEPPPGIRAGIALQFLEEQENQRAHSSIIKHNLAIREIAKQCLSIAGDYYEPEDGRLIRIVGKNNQFSIKSLEGAKLSGPYDIRVQNSSALPESKAGRVSTLIELRNTFGPGLVPDEHAADMLDLGQPDKFFDYVAVAIQKAEGENEDLLEGVKVAEPQPYEELLSHWRTHAKVVQSKSFGDDVPAKIKEAIFEHIETTEYLMYEKAFGPNANPLFKQSLLALENWPLFLPLPETEAPAIPQEAADILAGGPPSPLGAGQGPPPLPEELPEGSEGEPVPPGDAVPAGQALPAEQAPQLEVPLR